MAWQHRIANVFRRGKLHRDVDRELAFHLAERVDELCATGLPEAEARRQAQTKFGNLTFQIEETSAMNVTLWLDSALRHFRLALRSLAKTPGFTATVILTLALGIGANSAVFSALDAVILRPLPYPESERLVTLLETVPKGAPLPIAPVRLEDWNRLNDTFQAITGSYDDDTSETSGELPESLRHSHVAPRFLQTLGVSPALGRGFSPEEEVFGGPSVALLSDSYWRRRFGADPAAIGKQLRFGPTARTIIGVMPASFRFRGSDVDIWSPVPNGAPWAQGRGFTWHVGTGRLKRGVTLEQARANLSTIQAELGRQYPDTDARLGVSIEFLKESAIAGARDSLWLLYGSVTLLLLIACANIAALLLARATQRQAEISVRFSLGATRASVAAQLLTEAFVLSITGAAAGLFVAAASSRVFQTLAKALPRVDEISLNTGTVLYTLACSLAVTILCGLIPAIRSTRRDLRDSIAAGSRTQVSMRNPMQWVLVGLQVALSVMLLAGSGLMIRSFQQLARVSPGFDPSRILTFRLSMSWAETDFSPVGRQRVDRMIEGLRAIPGVEGAALGQLPGIPGDPAEVRVQEGRVGVADKLIASMRFISPGYFATMGIPLVAGEVCQADGPSNTVINQAFAETYFQGANPVGFHLMGSNGRPFEIRGITGDAREDGLTRAPGPTMYVCSATASPNTSFMVRTRAEPMALAETIRRKFAEIEPAKSVYNVAPLEEYLSNTSAEGRMITVLLSFFAFTAIALAGVGLYGTLSYFVNLRRKEVGLRLALGAARGQIVGNFLRQGLLVSVLGCLAGLALAAATTRLLAGMLFGVSPSDALTLASVVLLVLAVTSTAALLPSIRAARVEPMQVLRNE
jgi:putative ABC transport system permease protein